MEAAIIGLTLDEAKQLFPNYTFLATRINGATQIEPADYKPERAAVHTENGRIVKFIYFG